MGVSHFSIILTFAMSVLVMVTLFPNNINAESSHSNVITVGPKNLSSDIENILHYVSCGGPPFLTYEQLSQFVLDNNPNLKNQPSMDKSKILDLVVPTVEKKLVIESPEFKSIHGDNDTIVFDEKHSGPLPAVCFSYGSIGTFQTDSKERYKVSIGISPEYTYSFTLYPDLGLQNATQKYLVITQVELASKNDTQWVRIYNPNTADIPLGSLHLAGSNGESKYFDYNSTLESGHDMVVQLNHLQPSWSTIKNTISINSSYPDIYGNDLDTNANSDSPTTWDKTPPLTDTYDDSRTWQYNGTGWMFTDKHVVVPEFPFAVPILLVGIVSILIFYRLKSSFRI